MLVNTTTTVQLIAREGSFGRKDLYLPVDPAKNAHGDSEVILLYIYPAGDCDSVNWLNPNEDHLRGCLFDAREVGELPSDCREVLLPDGARFEF